MNDDLIEFLRSFCDEAPTLADHDSLLEAADEIERLRDDNQRLVNELLKYVSERDLHDLLTRHGGSGVAYSTEIMVAPSQPLLELDRLHALITAWADATDNDERDGWVGSEVIQAEAALRKAVGR